MRYSSPNLGFGIGFYRDWDLGVMIGPNECHLAIGWFAIWWVRT